MHALLNKINEAISPAEQARLREITADGALAAHVLPIRSVGVQVDFSYQLTVFFVLNCLFYCEFICIRETVDHIATCALFPRTRNLTGILFSSWPTSSLVYAIILTG